MSLRLYSPDTREPRPRSTRPSPRTASLLHPTELSEEHLSTMQIVFPSVEPNRLLRSEQKVPCSEIDVSLRLLPETVLIASGLHCCGLNTQRATRADFCVFWPNHYNG